jgi:hypothetical protein
MMWWKKKQEPLVAGSPADGGELDTFSGTWVFIRNHAEKEIARLRERNDARLDAAQTAELRGEIKALKALLALPNTQKKWVGFLAEEDE